MITKKEVNKRLKKVKIKHIQRLKELENIVSKSPYEWDEYYLLKHKYKGVRK